MTASANSTFNESSQHQGSSTKGNWSAMNIAAMVVGFIFFWPVGLVILYWNITGRDIKDLPGAVQEKWSSMFNKSWCGMKKSDQSHSENSVFNEYQQTQFDRIAEIKEEISNRAKSFKDFQSDAKRRADEAEFKEFMSADRS